METGIITGAQPAISAVNVTMAGIRLFFME